MRKYKLYLLTICLLIFSCTPSETEDLTLITEKEVNNFSGYISITDQKFADKLGLSNGNLTWIFNKDESTVSTIFSKNLTSSPYKLEITIRVNDDPNSPIIKFISDFDRKIIPGNRYKIFTTLNLFGITSFVPGNTGGQVIFNKTSDILGFSVGSECTIVIAEQGGFAINNSSQSFHLKGTFTLDNTANIDKEIGEFVIAFDGDNIFDLSFF